MSYDEVNVNIEIKPVGLLEYVTFEISPKDLGCETAEEAVLLIEETIKEMVDNGEL